MFEGIERIGFSKDWITLIFMLVLTIISIIKLNYSERFTKLFSLFYSDKYYTDYVKTNPLIFSKFHILFIFVIFFNISLGVYIGLIELKPIGFEAGYFLFVKILGIVFFYFIIRYLTGYFLGNIFEISDKQNHFTFFKISNLSLFSVLLFPILILINYSAENFHKFILIFGSLSALVALFYLYFKLFKKDKLNFNNLFYLFLYLCALEIAPFIVIYKMFVN